MVSVQISRVLYFKGSWLMERFGQFTANCIFVNPVPPNIRITQSVVFVILMSLKMISNHMTFS